MHDTAELATLQGLLHDTLATANATLADMLATLHTACLEAADPPPSPERRGPGGEKNPLSRLINVDPPRPEAR
jgi:hypothetical protein